MVTWMALRQNQNQKGRSVGSFPFSHERASPDSLADEHLFLFGGTFGQIEEGPWKCYAFMGEEEEAGAQVPTIGSPDSDSNCETRTRNQKSVTVIDLCDWNPMRDVRWAVKTMASKVELISVGRGAGICSVLSCFVASFMDQ